MKLDSLGPVVFCCHKTNVQSNPQAEAFFVWILTACRHPGSFYYSISAYETLPALCARSPFILKTCQRCNTRGRSCERTKVFSCVILQLYRGFCHIKLWASLQPDLCKLAHTPSHFKLKQKIWCIYRKTENCCMQPVPKNKTKQKRIIMTIKWDECEWWFLNPADSQNRFGITEESSKGIPKGPRYTQDKM